MRLFATTLLILLSFSCVTTDKDKVNDFSYFRISFEQENKIIRSIDNEVKLQRKSFSILFEFTGPEGVLINASFNPDNYNSAKEKNKLNSLIKTSGKGFQEELYNKEKSLNISEKKLNFWNFTSSTNHRFNEIIKKKSTILCRRQVNFLIDHDKDKLKVPVESFEGDFLYLIILKTEWNEDFTVRNEKKRDYYKIIFPSKKNNSEPLVILKAKAPKNKKDKKEKKSE